MSFVAVGRRSAYRYAVRKWLRWYEQSLEADGGQMLLEAHRIRL